MFEKPLLVQKVEGFKSNKNMSQLAFCSLIMQPVDPVVRCSTPVYLAEPMDVSSPSSPQEGSTGPKHVSFNADISIVPTYPAFHEGDDMSFDDEVCSANGEEYLECVYDRRGDDKVNEWTAPDKLQGVWNEIYALRCELFPNGVYFGDQQLRKSALAFF
eukprot:comp12846_c0_seq1/m.8013 comp12846_c0_seq1/g.8013  ORF comp12846_c0_seq1/g.8013 comp12846_c0_seq1/m.8013 type:complete len:159 (-) comp12846_c0_seq1:602-1078(-)